MASHQLHLLLPLLYLAVVLVAAPAPTGFAEVEHPYAGSNDVVGSGAELEHPYASSNDDVGFRVELEHPYARRSIHVHDLWRRSARASWARAARLHSRLAGADLAVPLAHLSDEGYTVTVGIGTPPQPHSLVVDTGSDLIWTQCKLFKKTSKQREPLFDPAKSSTFRFVPCSSRLCTKDNPGTKRCSNKTCHYHYGYADVAAVGVLASESFTFGEPKNKHKHVSLSLGFGCGALTYGNILGASGILGLGPMVLSMASQLATPKFSYCLTPYADRKSSTLLFGALADLQRYKTTGPIQSMPILRNQASLTFYYYVPLVGLSLGKKRLDVPASVFELKQGEGGTVLDSGSTIAHLVEPAFAALEAAVLHILDLPLTNETVKDYKVCFALPSGVAMSAIQTPPLTLHFDGGADMVLPRDNYFQEPRAGLMCLAVVATGGFSIIGNVQQQNFHVLYDLHNSKFLFAPTICDDI